MERLLIVGAGPTGALTAAILRKQLPSSTKICLWDKANGAGGRMSTSRNPSNTCTVDLGAQYISSSPTNYSIHETYYKELEVEGLLKPRPFDIEGERYPPDTKHFIAPKGVSSLVKYFLTQSGSGAEVKYKHQISDILQDGKKWNVKTLDGSSSSFDCVVLTMPVPQVLNLSGTIKHNISSDSAVEKKLKNVTYSSRYALGLFYKKGTTINVPWKAKYFYDDECIRFVAIDTQKRGIESAEEDVSICVHTSVPFSLPRLEEDKEDICMNTVLPALHKLIPDLPEPDYIKCHKWRYSQVHKEYKGAPAAVVLQNKPLLVLGGDGFIGSGFDNCLKSAEQLAEHVNVNCRL